MYSGCDIKTKTMILSFIFTNRSHNFNSPLQFITYALRKSDATKNKMTAKQSNLTAIGADVRD